VIFAMDNDNAPFPLEQWFDMSRRISKDDRKLCEAQMALYATKTAWTPKVRNGALLLRTSVRP
jgi:hypothetical protein